MADSSSAAAAATHSCGGGAGTDVDALRAGLARTMESLRGVRAALESRAAEMADLQEAYTDPEAAFEKRLARAAAAGTTSEASRAAVFRGEPPSLTAVARKIASGEARRIVVMVGAGISVSAGLPDFRTPGEGLYARLKREYGLEDPKELFDIGRFRRDPRPSNLQLLSLVPRPETRPTRAHHFLRLLHEKGVLLRVFTQNVDMLERRAGLPADRVVGVHGGFTGARCTNLNCRARFSLDAWRREVEAGEVPRCLKQMEVQHDSSGSESDECSEGSEGGRALGAGGSRATGGQRSARTAVTCGGFPKPDVVFFGEKPSGMALIQAAADFKAADLVLVMGTSLAVEPFCGLLSKPGVLVPRVLLNREPVGHAPQIAGGFEFEFAKNYRDVFVPGDCDTTTQQLCREIDTLRQGGGGAVGGTHVASATSGGGEVLWEAELQSMLSGSIGGDPWSVLVAEQPSV